MLLGLIIDVFDSWLFFQNITVIVRQILEVEFIHSAIVNHLTDDFIIGLLIFLYVVY